MPTIRGTSKRERSLRAQTNQIAININRNSQVNLDEPAGRKLFGLLSEQLERIEVSIDPYLELDLLEQWQLCIGEIVRRYEAGELDFPIGWA